ncbi:uncharacterized protein LOC123722971 [Papilio machaon]|uniref:uncharacterized protein LOC123722971 n=1 Tax=Papilio machaon TaxID=76193 RepID=UPI001E663ACF|nr:uncharacterized protein LOC123722971 [Papilio machaon]
MPEAEDPPPAELARLTHYCESAGLEILIGADTNAHHQLWGMDRSNDRGITDSPLCRACMGDEETASHVILHCPAVQEYRVKHLGSPRTLPEITDNIKGLLGFFGELGWLE